MNVHLPILYKTFRFPTLSIKNESANIESVRNLVYFYIEKYEGFSRRKEGRPEMGKIFKNMLPYWRWILVIVAFFM